MYQKLKEDLKKQKRILANAAGDSIDFLEHINEREAFQPFENMKFHRLPSEGLGALEVERIFEKDYLPYVPGSTGPRYFGYVIGGVTPAALAGDWIASAIDQNAFGYPGTFDERIEKESIQMVLDFLGLPDNFSGVFVSGATTSAFVAMNIARQWAAKQEGKSAADTGLYGLTKPEICSGCLHGANIKAMSMAGLGRSFTQIDCLPEREAVDVLQLEEYLKKRDHSVPLIYVANMATASSGDLDNLSAIASLKKEYGFYLHVDGAFGGAMASLEEYSNLFKSLKDADSITMDTHKWLNVPYDGAVLLTKHKELQYMAFTNAGSTDLPKDHVYPHYHLTPEGSRRLRALPVWFSMMAYGKKGHEEIVRNNHELCKYFANLVKGSPLFTLNNEVRANVVSFKPNTDFQFTQTMAQEILDKVNSSGVTFANYVPYKGKPALRVCMTNWRTTQNDVDLAFKEFEKATKEILFKYNTLKNMK